MSQAPYRFVRDDVDFVRRLLPTQSGVEYNVDIGDYGYSMAVTKSVMKGAEQLRYWTFFTFDPPYADAAARIRQDYDTYVSHEAFLTALAMRFRERLDA